MKKLKKESKMDRKSAYQRNAEKKFKEGAETSFVRNDFECDGSEISDEDLKNELQNEVESDNEENSIDSHEEEDLEESVERHIKSLAKLKENDPEFYRFLEENDKNLLNFNSLIEDDLNEEQEDKLHKPDGLLDVASDESDLEDIGEENSENSSIITLKLLKTWQSEIRTDRTNKTLNNLAKAFHAALMSISPEGNHSSTHFQVEGSPIFNAVIQICVLEFGPAVRRFLGISPGLTHQPHRCKKFVKIKKTLKLYFEDLLKLLSGVSSANIQTVLLKHLHYMSSMLTSFPHSTKSIIKQLIKIWGTADEGVRVISFFCILRITRNSQISLLDVVLRSMYMTFIKNSKFVTTSTLPAINFMRRSLVEMFALDLNVAYRHVFLYIRQLAIHLRNAIMMNKKENIQAVYNWQFMNSLKLWGNLLSVTSNRPQMQQLVYPFVQVCLGTIRLVPTAQYYPWRFHVTEVLMELARDTEVFIPFLPFIIDVLTSYDFNKKHQRVSMKPLQFTSILRLSKSQLGENGFKERLIETIYSQLLDCMTHQSQSIAFPELSFMCRTQIKIFLKKCNNANYQKKIKSVLEKLEQNSQFIDDERKKITLNLADFKVINGWESQIKNKGTPLSVFYESWTKVRNQKKRKEITNNEELGEYNLPKLKKLKLKSNEEKGSIELFPSDSEEEIGAVEHKTKRGKRGGKNVTPRGYHSVNIIDGAEDVLEDIDVNDW